MLSVKPITKSTNAAHYFTSEDGYYLSEKEAQALSSWWGRGAEKLGLSGKIDEKQFRECLNGRLPNGDVVGQSKNGLMRHRPGFDICFSAPKSVSIFALAGGDTRFLKAHQTAVTKTLRLIERDCAQARRYTEKGINFENTKNLVVARVEHGTSRELDPQMHTHCVVINATERSDGKWRALASSKVQTTNEIYGFRERVYRHQLYYGMVYQSELAKEIKQLGCEIEITGPNGLWEIKGIPQEVREILSKRRGQITAALKDIQIETHKAKDVATLNTRKPKITDYEFSDLKKVWAQELATVDFSSESFIKSLADKKLQETVPTVSIDAKDAVRNAIDYLSQFNVSLDYTRLATKAMALSLGDVSHIDIIYALQEAIKDNRLIPLNEQQSCFTTNALIEAEQALMDHVEQAKGKATVLHLKEEVLQKLHATESQKSLIKALLQSSDRLQLLEYRRDVTPFIESLLNAA